MAEVEAAKAEAETSKAAYAAAQEEIARLKAEAPAAQDRERFEAEKVILEAEAAEAVAAAKGAKEYALEDYQKGQALLAQAKDALASSAFAQSMENAREATKFFNMASVASSRAHEAEGGALKTASDRALAEERERFLREKEKAVAEERERCAREKEALAKELQLKAEVPKPTAAAKPERPMPAYHQVREGECLWTIAREIYGDPYQWPLIFRANRDKIHNPDVIRPRQNLTIPKDVSQEEINQAIKEASERPWPKK
jgi:nucleoid-associated protein YgaU